MPMNTRFFSSSLGSSTIASGGRANPAFQAYLLLRAAFTAVYGAKEEFSTSMRIVRYTVA